MSTVLFFIAFLTLIRFFARMDVRKLVARRIIENLVAKRVAFFFRWRERCLLGDIVRFIVGDDLFVVELMRRVFYGVSMIEKWA